MLGSLSFRKLLLPFELHGLDGAEVKQIARTGGAFVLCNSCRLSAAICPVPESETSAWCAHCLLAGTRQAQGLQQHLAAFL